MQQRVIISQDIEHDLAQAIAETEHDRVFVLTDDITQECCLPKVAVLFAKHNATTITIRHDDTNKTLATLADVWTALQRGGATRHSMLVNLGGGMVTDLGRLRCCPLQAWHQLHQHPHNAARHGRRGGGRQGRASTSAD